MKKKFLSLLLLTLLGCPNIPLENTKPKEIPSQKYTIQINVQANKNDYPNRIKNYEVNSLVINPTKSGLESQLEDSENILKDAIKENVRLILEKYNQNDKGIYTIEVDVIYSTGRTVFIIDDFELGKE